MDQWNQLKEYREKIQKLDEEEKKLRDLYLRRLALGEVQGAATMFPSIDKTWLKYYKESAILSPMPQMTIYRYMIDKNFLKDKALCYFGKYMTYDRLNLLIDRCAGAFVRNGVNAGDIVTICMPNTPEAVISFYALNKIGAVANMVHPLSGEIEIRNYLNEVKSKIAVVMDMAYDKVLAIGDETVLERIVVVKVSDSMPFVMGSILKVSKGRMKLQKDKRMLRWDEFIRTGIGIDYKEYPYEENRLSVILHTGGTTGLPKGVMLTNDNFNCMVEQFVLGENNFKRQDKMLTVMPVFHGFGLCSSVHLPLSLGVTAILIPKLNPQKMYKILHIYKPNHIIGVPTLFKAMLNSKKINDMDLSYLKYVVSGGDQVNASLEADINKFLENHHSGAKLCKGYGLSEAVAGATFASGKTNQPLSVGIPMVNTNVKIIDPGTGRELPQEEIGEICIEGPTVMSGYYNNKSESDKALQDGWLHTGDLGYFQNGRLFFTQRKGNVIVSSGVNVYPCNIERVIESHVAVAACAVVGVNHPYKMQAAKAYIILKEGYNGTEMLKEEIDSLCRKNLNVYSVPYIYEFREKLPQTLLGKISHKILQEEEIAKVS